MLATALDDAEFSWVHVDDVARGHLLTLERGAPGADYVLRGEPATVGPFLARAARLSGHRPPRVRIPAGGSCARSHPSPGRCCAWRASGRAP